MNWADFFRYEDGDLIRVVTTSSRAIEGMVAGSLSGNGYLHINIDGRRVKNHRIIWEMHNGRIPEGMEIDHINHIKTDNRIENLRLVSHKQNLSNASLRSDSSSGVSGVSWNRNRQKWHAYIKSNYKRRHIGFFDSFDDAVVARKHKEIELGLHENHGKTDSKI